MDRLTSKERSDLESVFMVICKENNSKFTVFYTEFFKEFIRLSKNIKKIKFYKKALKSESKPTDK